MLFHINSFRAAVYNLPHEGEVFEKSTTLALQSVFKNLQCSSKEVSTKDLTVAFGWTNAEAFMQQDVQEMMRVLIDKLEEKMRNTALSGFIKDLFAGSIRSYIRCVNVPYESKRDEDFYDIQLDVKGCTDIYDSFRKYTANEMLDGENQYDAGSVHGKQDAQKGVIFTKFPPVLTIHLKRFDFDMVTMGFRKIHDYYKFPEILELDKFLAEDSPPESRAVPNIYALHSVLVHSGDVGGGHYYAYIRPSKNFNYGSLVKILDKAAKSADDGSSTQQTEAEGELNQEVDDEEEEDDVEWFKFNDETVIQVETREAIQHCYGRRKTPDFEGPRLMSSAYMLVYIRLSEAGKIMQEITIQDIPKGLLTRLNAESTTRRQAELKILRERMFSDLQFATDEEVRDFTVYNKVQDFLVEKDFRTIRIMKDSTRLGALLLIANELKVSPINLRMWIVDRKKTLATNRVVDDVLVKDLDHLIKLERYYIQRLEPAEVPEGFEATFQDLRSREQHWVDELRKIIYSHMSDADDHSFFLASGEAEDPVEGCGIGMSNKPLEDLLKVDVNTAQRLMKELEAMTNTMMHLLEHCQRDMEKDEYLIFFKAYDPWNILRIHDGKAQEATNHSHNGADDSSSISDTSSEASDKDEAKTVSMGDSNALSEDGAASPQGQGVKSAKKTPVEPSEYLPIKYIGSAVVNGADHCNSLRDTVLGLLDKLAGVAGFTVPLVWLNKESYRIYVSDSPLTVGPMSGFLNKNKMASVETVLGAKVYYPTLDNYMSFYSY